MSRSTAFVANTNATASAMNLLRSDALGASRLLTHQQSTPGMTVAVEAGILFAGSLKITCAGGNTGTFTAPSTNPRIDLVTVDASGTIGTVTGSENASPVAPTYPYAKIVVAEITHRVGETTILDNENQTAGQGFITDVRPFFQIPSQASPVNVSGTYSLNSSYQNTSSRPQLHVITVQMSNGSGNNAFLSYSIDGGDGQTYLASGYPGTTTVKFNISFIVAPGKNWYTATGGTGSTPTIQYWYTMDL